MSIKFCKKIIFKFWVDFGKGLDESVILLTQKFIKIFNKMSKRNTEKILKILKK